MALPTFEEQCLLVNNSEKQELTVKVLLKDKTMNPFLASSELTVIEKETITTFIRKEENHCKVLSKTSEIKPVEVDAFAKVYHIGRKYGLVANLSAQGCRMFLYVQMTIEQDQDWVKLPAEEVGKRLNLSLLTVRLGIKDLIDNGILCKRGKSDYWINPIVLFSGNRLQYFETTAPDKIKRVKDRNPRVLHIAGYDKQSTDVFL